MSDSLTQLFLTMQPEGYTNRGYTCRSIVSRYVQNGLVSVLSTSFVDRISQCSKAGGGHVYADTHELAVSHYAYQFKGLTLAIRLYGSSDRVRCISLQCPKYITIPGK